MPAILMIGVSEKAPGDKVRLPCDFGNEPLLLAGYTITSYNVTCTGTTGTAPTVSGIQLDYSYQLSAAFTGGTPGTYDCTFTITLDDPDTSIRQRVGTLKVLG